MTTAEAVVIGGGVIGASTAHALAKAGLRRTLLVEKSALAAGATGRSSALVRMHYTNEWDARLAWKSFEFFRHWGDAVGGECGFTRTGFLMVVAPEYAEHLQRNVEMLRGIGVDTTAIGPGDVKALQPRAEIADIGAAAHEPESGYADPTATTRSLARRSQELGATIWQGTEVRGVRIERGRVVAVETSRGLVETPRVVVAAGPWAPRLCHQLGIALPVRPKRILTAVVSRPIGFEDPHMVYIDNAVGTYFRPETGGLTLVGARCDDWDIDPDHFNETIDQEAAVQATARAAQRLPALAEGGLARGWAGADGYSQDGHAVLDRAPGVEGLYLAVGMSGTGFKVAPAVGLCMAELILEGRAWTVDLHAFRFSRFAESAPLKGQYEYAEFVGLSPATRL